MQVAIQKVSVEITECELNAYHINCYFGVKYAVANHFSVVVS